LFKILQASPTCSSDKNRITMIMERW
jgi:hypothetical protein